MHNKNDNSRDSNGYNCVNADLFASRFLNQTLTADKENLIKPKTPEKLKRRQSGGWAMTLTADQPLEKSQTDFLINESFSCPLVFVTNLWLQTERAAALTPWLSIQTRFAQVLSFVHPWSFFIIPSSPRPIIYGAFAGKSLWKSGINK